MFSFTNILLASCLVLVYLHLEREIVSRESGIVFDTIVHSSSGNVLFVSETNVTGSIALDDTDTQPRSVLEVVDRVKLNAVVFVCNQRYGSAAASSLVSVRNEGGYQEDVILIVDEDADQNFTSSWLENEVINQGGSMERVFMFTATDLLNSLIDGDESIAYLSEAPAILPCMAESRQRGHRGYYLKSLIFHPWIATRWDTVLCKFLPDVEYIHNQSCAHINQYVVCFALSVVLTICHSSLCCCFCCYIAFRKIDMDTCMTL